MTSSATSDSRERYDLVVRGGMVVDGTGLSRRRVDVGVRDGRVVKLGHLPAGAADREIDATGMVVAPGIVDVHTHYDPQITFDPYAAMSSYHGVTTVVAGNCGFSVAPTRTEDRPFLEGIFAAVRRHGADEAGAIFIKVNRLDGNADLYAPHYSKVRAVTWAETEERATTADRLQPLRNSYPLHQYFLWAVSETPTTSPPALMP